MPALKHNQVLKWSEQLATGLAEVDDQHQRLIDIINALGDLREQGAPVEEVLAVIDELRSYTRYHFQDEAALMQTYPVNEANRLANLKAHRNFVERIDSVAAMAASNPADVVDHLLAFLVKWLVHHITGVDARLVREVIALRSGEDATQFEAENNPLHDSLIDTVSDLYDTVGARTFEMLEMNRQLRAYQELQEQENALAQDIIVRMMRRGGLSDSKLQHWLVPAATFSGDIIAATRGASGHLYAILADASGHGLAAAITVLPVMTTFYSMAERDRPVAEMVGELNRNLIMTLPTGRFVAAALLCIDETNGMAEIWNSGMPALLLLSPQGELAQTLAASQLPLGIADYVLGTPPSIRVNFAQGSQLVMYSDGLIEAANAEGEPFGTERLIAALTSVPADQRLSQVQRALTSHLGSVSTHDDVSLLLAE